MFETLRANRQPSGNFESVFFDMAEVGETKPRFMIMKIAIEQYGYYSF
jgi:hypothetical protein